MKVKRMGITESLRRIWLFSANKIKSSESEQPTQLIVELNSSLRHIIVTIVFTSMTYITLSFLLSVIMHFVKEFEKINLFAVRSEEGSQNTILV